ncbi:hypothetical protein SteCoe_8049 [Stentor coeruleus]|uniref:G domain-containing protein n=1 Tax=Stentor coeruleus TaxID=5963 RepID=A0A1R2CKZ3_9CILI|nr:hypothetical protein SteCoe_8049 [Stentor coeruleus]
MNSAHLQEEIKHINDSISKCDEVLPKKALRTVVLLGNTGAGKSTVFNILCGNELKIIENQYDGSLNFDLKYSGDFQKIGNSASSCTSLPSYKNIDLTTFIDTPGLEDNNGKAQQIINIFYIKKVFSVSSKVKIILFFDYDSIMISRGKNLGDLFNHLLELIPDKQLLKQSMNFLITRCPQNYTSLFFKNKVQELCLNNNYFANSSDVILNIIDNLDRVIIFKSPLDENDINLDIKDKVFNSLGNVLWSSVKINPSVGQSAQLKLRSISSELLAKLNKKIDKKKSCLVMRIKRMNSIKDIDDLHKGLQNLILISNEDNFFNSLVELINKFTAKRPFMLYFRPSVPKTPKKILETKRLLDFYKTITKIEISLEKMKEFIPGLISLLQSRKVTVIQEKKLQQAKEEEKERQRQIQRLNAEREEAERRRRQIELEYERLRIQQREQEERNRIYQEQLRQERLRQEQREREHREWMEKKRQEELYLQRRVVYTQSQSNCTVF